MQCNALCTETHDEELYCFGFRLHKVGRLAWHGYARSGRSVLGDMGAPSHTANARLSMWWFRTAVEGRNKGQREAPNLLIWGPLIIRKALLEKEYCRRCWHFCYGPNRVTAKNRGENLEHLTTQNLTLLGSAILRCRVFTRVRNRKLEKDVSNEVYNP